MVESVAYLSTFITAYQDIDKMCNDPYAWFSGKSPIYRTYQTLDDKYVAVGAIEKKFAETLFKTLQLKSKLSDLEERPEVVSNEMETTFRTRTRREWTNLFNGVDACVTPVLDINEVALLKHHQMRSAFTYDNSKFWPCPAPRFYTADDFARLRDGKVKK
ncbi:unnamed protein product [Anisakis simplex]|uniref:Alpha-methylacyl-CoA racemase (inferred by orthology to a human protein) n=1 Tax=Anisakis simplex TaxID=6269 RepID=A0A0M3J4J2_ANISI|nr:unnamed protein product [Anisakis simplex]